MQRAKVHVLHTGSGTVVLLRVAPIFSSDRSSCTDDGLLYIRPLFQIFTQSLDAIDVTSVTLSRLNSINVIDVTRCWLNVECSNVPMFQCSNVPVFQCSNVPLFQWSNVLMFHWSIGPLDHWSIVHHSYLLRCYVTHPGRHNLRGFLATWFDPESFPHSAYVKIFATFATKGAVS